jgi:hypothetical protein
LPVQGDFQLGLNADHQNLFYSLRRNGVAFCAGEQPGIAPAHRRKALKGRAVANGRGYSPHYVGWRKAG